MNNKTVFVRTAKGEAEASGETSLLFGEAKRVFMLVNNKSSVDDMRKHAAPSLRANLEGILEQLERDEFIRDRDDTGPKKPVSSFSPKIASPKISVPPRAAAPQGAAEQEDALDFTSDLHPPMRDTGGQPKPAEAPAGPDELDFSSLISQPAAGAKPPAAAPKPAPEQKKAGPAEIDFSSILSGAAPAADAAKQEAEVRARAEAEAKARAEAEAKARAEAEAKARMRAQLEAKAQAEAEAKARAAAEERMRAEAEARARAEERTRQEVEARARAEAEAKTRMRAELEAKMRAEAEAKARAELEAKARAEAQARAEAERAQAAASSLEEFDFSSILQPSAPAGEPDRARIEAEARMRAEAETKARADADARMRAEAEAKEKAEAAARARVRAELEAGMGNLQVSDPRMSSGQNQGRSMIATVLFFDVVGYTKQSVARQLELKAQFNALISGLIGHIDENQRIILDTGDGAAIGFLQHPEDALDVALKFRAAVTVNGHRNYPDLKVRAGIHLGPVNVMKDMNGQLNMVGDGINDSQRIMSFAGVDQIYISRAYFDVISRLTPDSAGLFKYQGTQKDKHGRDHQVYQVLGDGTGMSGRMAAQPSGGVESLLQDLSVMLREEPPAPAAPPPAAPPPAASGEWQPMEIPGAPRAPQERHVDMAQAEAEARARAQQEAARAGAEEEAARAQAAEEEAARARDEEAARKLAADQAKAFAEAEKRARKIAEAEEKARQREAKLQAKAQARESKKRARQEAAAAAQTARHMEARKKAARPMRAKHGFPVFKTLFLLIVLAVAAVVGLPNFWPMQAYIPQVEQELSSQLGQPVRVAGMHVTTVPAPKLDLEGVTIGQAQQLKIGHVALYFDPLSLPSHVRTLTRVDVEHVSVNADTFMAAAPWLLAAGSSEKYPLQTMELKDVRIAGSAPLPAFGGKITFDAYGKVAKARLISRDGKYGVVLEPKDRAHTHVEVSVTDGSLLLLPAIEFGDLELAGDMAGNTINFTSLSGNLYGGSITGVATLSWQNGWQVQGNASFQSIVMKEALPGLKVTGELEGAAAFALTGANLAQLTSAPHLDGTFRVKDGQIDGIDVAETLRTDTRQAAAGQTHFDTVNGSMRLDSGGMHLKPIKIGAGALSINGAADATLSGALSGHFLVDTSRVRVGLGTLPLRLSGTVTAPVWAVGR